MIYNCLHFLLLYPHVLLSQVNDGIFFNLKNIIFYYCKLLTLCRSAHVYHSIFPRYCNLLMSATQSLHMAPHLVQFDRKFILMVLIEWDNGKFLWKWKWKISIFWLVIKEQSRVFGHLSFNLSLINVNIRKVISLGLFLSSHFKVWKLNSVTLRAAFSIKTLKGLTEALVLSLSYLLTPNKSAERSLSM